MIFECYKKFSMEVWSISFKITVGNAIMARIYRIIIESEKNALNKNFFCVRIGKSKRFTDICRNA